MSDKQKKHFIMEYQKRFKRERNFAHPKLLQQAQVSEKSTPVKQESPKEEIKQEDSPLKRSPQLSKSLLHASPQYEAEALELFEKRFNGRDRYLRGLGPITGISLLKHHSPRRSTTLDDNNTELVNRFSYNRPSLLEGRNMRASSTPSQNLIQNLLNEYLPISPTEQSEDLRLSAHRKSNISDQVTSFDNGGDLPLKNHHPLQYFEHRTKKLEIVPLKGKLENREEYDELSTRGQYGMTQYTHEDVQTRNRITPDNINEEIGRVLEEEEELKESARKLHTFENQSNSGWQETSYRDPQSIDSSELQILEDDYGLSSLNEEQIKLKPEERELMNDYLKRSTITQK